MEDLTRTILKLRQEYAEVMSRKATLDRNVHDLNAHLNNILCETLSEYGLEKYVAIALVSNYHTGWNPYFNLSLLHDGRYSRGYFIYLRGKWVYSLSAAPEVSVHQLDFKKELVNVDLEDLKNFCGELEAETGLKVKFDERKVKNLPSSVPDLLAAHDRGNLVAQGKKGNDPWAIVKTKKGHPVVYYSTNGVGLGYDQCLMPEKDAAPFLDWLNEGLPKPRRDDTPAEVLNQLVSVTKVARKSGHEDVTEWLRTPLASYNALTPLYLLRSGQGASLIVRLLGLAVGDVGA
jgi:hypothetical protein